MSFKSFLVILRARIWFVLGVFAVVFGGTLGLSLLITPKYSATSQLLIDVKNPDPVAGGMLPAHLLNSYISTQVELLTSEKVALRVVDSLKLAQDPERLKAWQQGSNEVGSLRHAIAGELIKKLKVKPARDSNMLLVTYTDSDRTTVAPITNAWVKAFIDTTVDIRVSPAQQTREFFEDQSRSLRVEVEKAQARLTEFQRANGILANDERLDIENARLSELSTQLTLLQGTTIESKQRQQMAAQSMRQGGSDAPEVLSNTLIQSLKTELARSEAKIREQSAVLGPNHPEMQKLQSEAESLRARLAQETNSLTSSLAKTHEVNRQRETEVRASLEQQRGKVVKLRQARDELAVIQRDLENHQRAYDAAMLKLSQSSLEARATQANIVPINVAIDPTLPTSPNVPLNALISAILGVLLGVVGALMLEMSRAHIRIPEDLEKSIAAPLIGVLGHVPAKFLKAPSLKSLPAPAREPRLTGPSASASTAARTAEGAPGAAGAATGDSVTDPSGQHRDPVGETLVDAGLIKVADVEKIADIAAKRGIRFGQAAVESGYVSEPELAVALAQRQHYPLLDKGANAVAREVIAAFDKDHPFMDDLRVLRSQIKARFLKSGIDARRVIAVVSQDRGEGKSFTAANLAVSFAQLGERTLLIDGDMRNGRLHALFNVANDVGLTNVLASENDPMDVLKPVPGLENLTVIPSGPEVASPSDLLARDTMTYLLDIFARAFDIIIVDTPNASGKPDASLIVASTKGYVIVARENKSLISAVEKLATTMNSLDATLIGSVLVKA
jgi:chain length determinant protein tyrosine kinase EpsG